jgi:DNA-directed RNA polymerase subunit alpha
MNEGDDSMMIRAKDFQIPRTLEVEKETLTSTYGKFFAEPFERGFGTTIGNSIRRILLSSISGAAVTSIRVEGVFHEFSGVTGVKEDITEMILNIKNLRLRLHSDGPKMIHIKKKGTGVVLGKDILHDADVEILTPDLHLATLDKDGSLDMDLTVKRGRGYLPAEQNREEGKPLGVIPIDAIFSPIRKVNVAVESARVGRTTDYDKLILEIWTDGSYRPEEVLSFSAKILKEHLGLFMDASEEEVFQDAGEEGSDGSLVGLSRSVSELELSVRAVNCLKSADIRTIGDLVSKTEGDMLRTKNFGSKSLDEIKEALKNIGLSLGT